MFHMNSSLQINPSGTLTLPKVLRRDLGVAEGCVVRVDLRNNTVVLQPAVTFPVELYTPSRMAEFDAADAELGKRLRKRKRAYGQTVQGVKVVSSLQLLDLVSKTKIS
jgi:bifunctional DNA-binding transcriptional regulator/antitoxin component of YhaV-PrlF toxin-antitoxin module